MYVLIICMGVRNFNIYIKCIWISFVSSVYVYVYGREFGEIDREQMKRKNN